MSATPVDIRATLEFAGADVHAVEGSIGWKLAQVDAAVAELIEAVDELDAAWAAYGLATGVKERNEAWARVEAASPRRKAARARCKGGAA